MIKDVLSDLFGYDKYADLTGEHAIRGTYCDLAIKVDDKLAQLNTCYVPITNAVNTTARRLLDSLNQLGGEIEDGFCRIHKALQ